MERRAVARCSTPPTGTFTAISADRASTRNVAPRVRRIQVCKLTPHIVVSCCAVHPGVEIEPGHHAINARRASELRCRSKRPRPRRQADRASHDPHGTQCERQYPAIRRLIPRRAAINGRFFGDDATSRGRACDNRRSLCGRFRRSQVLPLLRRARSPSPSPCGGPRSVRQCLLPRAS